MGVKLTGVSNVEGVVFGETIIIEEPPVEPEEPEITYVRWSNDSTTESFSFNRDNDINFQLTLYGDLVGAYSIDSGSLPAGMNLSPDGVLTGPVTEAGDFTAFVRVEVEGFFPATLTLNVNIWYLG